MTELKEISRQLARFIVETHPENLHNDLIEKAKECFLDWIGCALMGSTSEAGRIFLDLFQEQAGIKEATILGNGKNSCLNGALINGAISHVMEFDDVHRGSISHPSAAVIPAALAIAETQQVSGRIFLASIILGYEAALRIGEAVSPSHYKYWHTTGTCGTFGAAAAAGKIMELDEIAMLNALGNAGTQAAGLWEFASDGAMSKVLHTGKAAMNGLLSAMLAQRGFTGPTKILEGERGFCQAYANEYDLGRVTIGLGNHYKIMEVWLKAYPCCGHTHTTITAVLSLMSKFELHLEEIAEVRVRVYSTAIEIAGNSQPETVQEAKFSLPYCVAAALKFKKVGLAEFAQSVLADSEIWELMSKVELIADTGSDKIYPGIWMSSVEIEIKSGRLLKTKISYPPGDPQNPMSAESLLEKFKKLAGSVMDLTHSQRIIEGVKNLEEIDNMSKFTDLFREYDPNL